MTKVACAGHVHIPPSKVDWAPTVVTGTIPNGSNFHKAPVVAYASSNDFVFNFGHALFDFLFPVFNMLYIMGAYDPEFQLLLADHQVIATSYSVLKMPFMRTAHSDDRSIVAGRGSKSW